MRTPYYEGRVVAVLKIEDNYLLLDNKQEPYHLITIESCAGSIDFMKMGGMYMHKYVDDKLYEITLDEAKGYIKEHFPDKFKDIFGKRLNKSRKLREREA